MTKQEQEVVAYAVALLETELTGSNKKIAQGILGKFQAIGVWGTLKD